MPSLADLFNPSFLMFLGILVLVAALLVVYFESKLREQNHKITSMFSLVSSLAEEVNGIKFNLTQISLQQNGGFFSTSENDRLPSEIAGIDRPTGVFRKNDNNNLISVSDDDSDSDSDSETNDDNDLESIDSSDNSNDDDEEEQEEEKILSDNINDVKILKLNIQGSKNIHDENNNLGLNYHNDNEDLDLNDLDNLDNIDDLDDLNDLNDVDDELSETQSISSKKSISIELAEKLLSVEYGNLENQLNDKLDENFNSDLNNNTNILDISSSDFKTININLEETTTENIDYKKLSIPKLRSIVAEKKLSTDTSKLKKPELLKLLGVE